MIPAPSALSLRLPTAIQLQQCQDIADCEGWQMSRMNISAERIELPCDGDRWWSIGPDRLKTWTGWCAHCRGWLTISLLVPAAIVAGASPLHCRPGTYGHFLFESLGWFLFVSGAAFRWWATLYVGGRKGHTLVSDGPYSVTRNPIYLGTGLLTMSVGVLSQSLVFLAATALVSGLYM